VTQIGVSELEPVPNVIPEVPEGALRVGFAAETDTSIAKSARQAEKRGVHLLCNNDVSRADTGFEIQMNEVWSLGANGLGLDTPRLPKLAVGHHILDVVESCLAKGGRARGS
jgi:phosphopantothenoylcysteine synthetase/decarboxylase